MAKANSYLARLHAARQARYRARQYERQRALLFRLDDLTAMLKARDEVIAVMLAELQEYHRHERIRSLVAELQKAPKEPEN
jgi:uncharacterized protein with von Willebrand factor type A (vWA) domain